MKLFLTFELIFTFVFTSVGQIDVAIGYTYGLNTYIENTQDNLSTKFNIGWDFDQGNPNYLIDFLPSADTYTINHSMNWNKTTSGMVVGLGFKRENNLSYEMNFVGSTNKASGSRINDATSMEESFTLKTKFGGMQFLTLINLNDRISVNVGMGMNLFRTRYSWSGATEITHQTIGLRINPFSEQVKIGDRSLTLTFPVGLTAKLLELESSGISLRTRLNYTFVWNSMVQTELIDHLPYSYNLNGASLALILSKSF